MVRLSSLILWRLVEGQRAAQLHLIDWCAGIASWFQMARLMSFWTRCSGGELRYMLQPIGPEGVCVLQEMAGVARLHSEAGLILGLSHGLTSLVRHAKLLKVHKAL
jgi:hypothetical protein